MFSPRHHRQRSIEEPPEISEVIDLKDKLNRLHEQITPECNKHIKKMTDLVSGFEDDYRNATLFTSGGGTVGGIGVVAMIVGLALAVFTGGASAVALGLGVAGAAATTAGGLSVYFGEFRKEQQEKNLRQNIDQELQQFENKINPLINMLEKIFNHIQKILRDPTLSTHKASAIHERFSFCFEKTHLFQKGGSREVGAQKHSTGNLSEIFAEMSYVLEILKEIIEDDEEQEDERLAETPRHKQLNDKEFTEKAEKFINEMRKGINQLENTMNEINQIKQQYQRA